MVKRIFSLFMLYTLTNSWVVFAHIQASRFLIMPLAFALAAFFLYYNVNPREVKNWTARIEVLMGGRELLINVFLLFLFEILLYIYLGLFSKVQIHPTDLIVNGLICLVLLIIVAWNAIIRLICTSTQLSLFDRLALLFALWVPVANIFLTWHCCRKVRDEYLFDMAKKELTESRKENEICKTKYPILLVHGIFWRDWQLFNYWGRIPKELKRNGATVFYGNQQSAAPMATVAGELKRQILQIVARENCEKVNILAHSKGGLDARYMISCLSMEKYVASLTTICTPHAGSVLLDKILKRVPDSLIHRVAKRYNAVYKKLGDSEPDFYAGLMDLKTEQCAQFNQTAVNQANVLYQSFASKMSGFFSAGFPLNIGYAILRRAEGENDGFVSVKSSRWGDYLGCFHTKHKRGVSHGDMIDLMRENIRGFDVCESYVGIVKGLKERGM